MSVQRDVGLPWEPATYVKSYGAEWRGWHRVALTSGAPRYIDSMTGLEVRPEDVADNPRAYQTTGVAVPTQRIRAT